MKIFLRLKTKDEKISSLQAANLAQQERIAALEAMLDKSAGHKAMSNNINRQKKVTRDALTYIAEIKRDRSMLLPTIDQISSISIDQVTDQEKKQEESQQLRDEKLMQLLSKCEIPK